MKKGWFKDSYRHSLAAKGISTKRYYGGKRYYADRDIDVINFLPVNRADQDMGQQQQNQQSVVSSSSFSRAPTTRRVIEELRAEQMLRRDVAALQVADRPVSKILRDVESNRFEAALAALRNPVLFDSPDETSRRDDIAAVRSAMNARALSMASAGVPVSSDVMNQLDPAVSRNVSDVLAARRRVDARLAESPATTMFREAVPGAIGSLAETPVVGVNWLGSGRDEELQQSLLSNIDNEVPRPRGGSDTDLKDSPFRTTNVFVGSEEDGMLKPLQEPLPRLSESFSFVGAAGATNPVLKTAAERGLTSADYVDKQVNELYESKKSLADVNLNYFDKGNKAFEQGDREGLISAITKLQAEEQRLKDRYAMVNVTAQSVVSRANHDALFTKQSSDNFLMSMMGRGGDRLVDQTNKINDVREKIIQANNKVFARRRQLEYRLKRLDSSVPPETSVPLEVTRFKHESKSSNPVLNAPNLVLDTVRSDFS